MEANRKTKRTFTIGEKPKHRCGHMHCTESDTELEPNQPPPPIKVPGAWMNEHQPVIPPKPEPISSIRLIPGAMVEYYSRSRMCWIPTVVEKVDAESGDVYLKMKPKHKFSRRDQDRLLRPRTKPNSERLDWIRMRMREGRMDTEGYNMFLRYCHQINDVLPDGRIDIISPLIQNIRKTTLPKLGADIDLMLGVSGCQAQLEDVFESMTDQEINRLRFVAAFWELVWGVVNTYANTLHKNRCVRRRKEDPRGPYNIQKLIGNGTYGSVFLAQCNTSTAMRAIKKLDKVDYDGDADDLDREIQHLCTLDHPHISKVYEFFEFHRCIFIVMDFCSGGELHQQIHKLKENGEYFSEAYTKEVLRQVFMAIAHVHAQGIMHLDIKCANIMLMDTKNNLPPAKYINTVAGAGRSELSDDEMPHVMLIDLGVSQVFRPGNFEKHQPRGTPATMAPEVWDGVLTPQADIFSAGVVFFEMMAQFRPFHCPSGGGNARAVINNARMYWNAFPTAPFEKVPRANLEAKQLCKDMLELERHRRPTSSQCLESDFLHVPKRLDNVCPTLLERFGKWPEKTLLHKSVALSIAHGWPANQLPTIKQVFEDFDSTGSGLLDIAQVTAALEKLGIEKKKAAKTAESLDLSRDGAIEWTEFVAACVYLSDDALTDDLRQIFNEVDEDGDGYVCLADVQKLLVSEFKADSDSVREIFRELSGSDSKSARVNFTRFRHHFRSITQDPESPKAPARNDQVARRISGQKNTVTADILASRSSSAGYKGEELVTFFLEPPKKPMTGGWR